MQLEQHHIVVSGGTGGLGRAVVGRLLEDGAIIHLPNFHAKQLEGYPHRDHPNVVVETGIDLSDEGQVDAFFDSCPPLWASVHLAGGFAMASLADTTAKDFAHMIDINLRTAFLCCRAAARRIDETGRGGRIVNVSARPGVEPRSGAGMAVYAASKAAVAALTEALGEELAKKNIWVNAVAPSIIDTAANREAMPKANHDTWPKPEEIAETIAFLVSPGNQVTRGGIVPVYGKF
ncbi:MAG: SDR family NAD(P)-dependent oxidoreductase [Alphaproteobacteria bacterium]|nr:SDR family NAD(P)-dependent oxidoreductase [Alphaproteobacteria bacterium]